MTQEPGGRRGRWVRGLRACRASRSTARATWSSARLCAICRGLPVPSLPAAGSASCPAGSACSAAASAVVPPAALLMPAAAPAHCSPAPAPGGRGLRVVPAGRGQRLNELVITGWRSQLRHQYQQVRAMSWVLISFVRVTNGIQEAEVIDVMCPGGECLHCEDVSRGAAITRSPGDRKPALPQVVFAGDVTPSCSLSDTGGGAVAIRAGTAAGRRGCGCEGACLRLVVALAPPGLSCFYPSCRGRPVA